MVLIRYIIKGIKWQGYAGNETHCRHFAIGSERMDTGNYEKNYDFGCSGLVRVNRNPGDKSMKCGLIFRFGSVWIGVHWSSYNRRFCCNLIPCVTIWITLQGGKTP